MANYDYFYNKAIIHDFETNNTFIKVSINNSVVTCSNKIILEDIKEKVRDMNILLITFYTSLYDYEQLDIDAYYETIKDLPLKELPIYKKNSDIKKYFDWMKHNFNNDSVDVYETGKFTKRESLFDNQEKCLKSVVYENTNFKFDNNVGNFNQLFYHIGDENDYQRFGSLYLRTIFNFHNELSDKSNDKIIVTENSINNTFDYLFNYMKKGILVGIKSNKLAMFLPFSKYDYKNDYYEELYFDEDDRKLLLEYKNIYDNVKRTHNNDKNTHNNDKNTHDNNKNTHNNDNNIKDLKRRLENNVKNFYYKNHLELKEVNLDRTRWVSNNGIFNNTTYEGDQNEALCENFLSVLCEERVLPDCVFFINLRDNPMLRKDYKNSYDSITDKKIPDKYLKPNDNNTNTNNNFPLFAPIFSPGCSSEHLDIPFITHDDWLRISQKYFPDDCKNGYIENNNKNLILDWNLKKGVAIFRGSSTGTSMTINDNMRLKASELSLKYPNLLDAGITSFNRKMKKQFGKPITIINTNDVKQYKKNFIDNAYKSQFKYILTIDGHVSAFRLSNEFKFKSVLLLPESKFYMWFSKELKPFIHYVPIKSDLFNLIEMIEWCKNNDEKCKVIAENGYDFYVKHLGKDGMLDYMQKQLNKFYYLKPIINNPNQQLSKYVKSIATSICIITPYRDDLLNSRLKQKRLFNYFMENMLKKYMPDVNFTLLVAEQYGNGKFNIGKIKNAGYLYLKDNNKTFDNIIFLDIDSLVDSELIKYLYEVTDGFTTLMANGSRYNKDNTLMMGSYLCQPKTFEEINGYSLLFARGWGGDDNNIISKIFQNNFKIYIPKNGSIIDMEVNEKGIQKTIKEKIEELKNESNYDQKKWELLTLTNLNETYGLRQTKYNILNKFVYDDSFNNFLIHIIIDISDKEQDKKIEEIANSVVFNQGEYDKFKKMVQNVKTDIY